MRKMNTNKSIEGGVELDRHVSTIILTENELEQQVEKFAEATQSACNRTFPTTNTGKKNRTKKSVPWWMESLTIMRKRVNAHRRLNQRTRNDEEQRERRKTYIEEKYQAEIKKEKFKSWKE
jgi:hypothetical protein